MFHSANMGISNVSKGAVAGLDVPTPGNCLWISCSSLNAVTECKSFPNASSPAKEPCPLPHCFRISLTHLFPFNSKTQDHQSLWILAVPHQNRLQQRNKWLIGHVCDCSDINRGLQKAASVLLSYFLERIILLLPNEQGPEAVRMSKALEGEYKIELSQTLSKR